MKDTIFISHANPENNYFAAWLASKLRLLGYKVWVDVSEINPGQYFNRDYENAILNDTIRFVAVISKDYINKARRNDSGVMNEILCARTIKAIDNFILPLRYDDSSYDDFPVGIRGRDAISFNDNWAEGLKILVEFFEKIDVPKVGVDPSVITFWFEAQKIRAKPLKKREKYFTNWFEVLLPNSVYVHQFTALENLNGGTIPFTFIREADRLITFASRENVDPNYQLQSSYELKTNLLLSPEEIVVDQNFTLKEPNKKLTRLLNKTFSNFLREKGLRHYVQANKKDVFFFPYSQHNKKMINLKSIGKGRRALIGTSSDFTWYFGISHSAILFPAPAFRIFYHLIFTDNGGKFLDQNEQHELRRSIASTWFNRKWLETLLAMMYKISDYNNDLEINIPVAKGTLFKIKTLPIELFSEYGYKEPSNEDELEIL